MKYFFNVDVIIKLIQNTLSFGYKLIYSVIIKLSQKQLQTEIYEQIR